MSALGQKADVMTTNANVRFVPIADILPLRLLAVTGRRNFAACSLVEG